MTKLHFNLTIKAPTYQKSINLGEINNQTSSAIWQIEAPEFYFEALLLSSNKV